MRELDWASTALGPVEAWPASLRTAVGICLSSRYPMVIWWGPELTLLYNDAWVPILGPVKHPALGRPGSHVWPEMWHIIGRQLDSVMSTGEATFSDDQLLPAFRFGYLEEAYFTYSYSAIRDENGRVDGVFTAVTETTTRVLGERRLKALRVLGETGAALTTRNHAEPQHDSTALDDLVAVAQSALGVLADFRADVPYAALYLMNADAGVATRAAGMGLTSFDDVFPETLAPGAELWRAAFESGDRHLPGMRARIHERLIPHASPVGDDVDDAALLWSLPVAGATAPTAFLVSGVSAYRALDEDYTGFFATVAGRITAALTDAQALSDQRRRAQVLADLDRAKSAFFANVSHEFRTPLTLITGPVEDSLADATDPLPPAQRTRLLIIKRNAARLRRLVDDMLDFASVEAGKLALHLVFTDLAALTRELVESFAPAVERAGLTLHIDIGVDPIPVRVDIGMWEKVVLNLLSNAVKYTVAGSITTALRTHDAHAELSVTDTGVGVSAEDIGHLFERFYRVSGGGGRSHEGAGIGLALTAELIGLHEGTVGVESEPDHGSTFTVTLPLGATAGEELQRAPAGPRAAAMVDEAQQWARSEASPEGFEAEGGPQPTATVLVVEDNADLRRFIADLLSPHWRVIEAADGLRGLELARTEVPDLILTDVMMPGLDGFELLERVRSTPATAATAVVMLSARAGEEAAIEGLAAGADDYLAKPFSSAELLARVRSNIELARFRNQESRFRRALVGSLQEGFFVVDSERTMIEVNDAFTMLTGQRPERLPGRWPYSWLTGTPPEQWQSLSDTLEHGGRCTVPVTRENGRTTWLEFSCAELVDGDDHRRVVVGTARDVTAARVLSMRQTAVAAVDDAVATRTDLSGVMTTAAEELARAFHAPWAVAVWHDPVDNSRLVRIHPAGVAFEQLPDAVREALDAEPGSLAVRVRSGPDAGRYLVAGLDASIHAAVAVPANETAFPADDLEMFSAITTRLAQSVVKARDYDRNRAVALTLQHAILGPTALPRGFAARYVPAEAPLEVGGDWYDVVPISDGRIGVVVGDCVGHGLASAAVMGQLRSACQAILLHAADPAEVLTELDLFARRIPGAQCATVFCAIIDPAQNTMDYATAGHPPAIAVSAFGAVDVLDSEGRSIPLAVLSLPPKRPFATTSLTAGATVVAYTDGLIDSRSGEPETSHAQLVAIVNAGRTAHPDAVADELIATLAPTSGFQDDVAILLYRHPPAPLAVTVSAEPRSLGPIRAKVRTWIESTGADSTTVSDLTLAVCEAATNSIEHAGSSGAHAAARPIRVTITGVCEADHLDLTIEDNGVWRPPPAERGNRGHGIALMRALSTSVMIDTTNEGTTVHLRKEFDKS